MLLRTEAKTCRAACANHKPAKACRATCASEFKVGKATCSFATNAAPPDCGIPTSSSTTLPPGCGNGVIDPGEQCDGAGGNLDGVPLGCFPPGSADECHLCGTTRCRFIGPGGIDFPCCDASKTCVITSPYFGQCEGPADAVCGNRVAEPGEQCDLSPCDDNSPFGEGGCFPPGDAHQCQCCSVEKRTCLDSPTFPATILCCPGLTCAHYPPESTGGFGLGECASTCAPLGTECGANGLSCCSGTCAQPDPSFPHSFCR